jgi:hypothetical protein
MILNRGLHWLVKTVHSFTTLREGYEGRVNLWVPLLGS